MDREKVKAQAAADQNWKSADQHFEQLVRLSLSGLPVTKDDQHVLKLACSIVVAELLLRSADAMEIENDPNDR